MNIILKDEQGLGFALSMDGFSRPIINEAKNSIRVGFKSAAQIVFSEVLETELPEALVIQLVQSSDEELTGKRAATMASFNSELSTKERLVFNIHEITVKEVIADFSSALFSTVITHEMIHAADFPQLSKNRSLLNSIKKQIQSEQLDSFGNQERNNKWALFGVLRMLEHYRAEGIAILGECLLEGKYAVRVKDPYGVFNNAFVYTVMNAKKWASTRQGDTKGLFDDDVYQIAYSVSPYILLAVMGRCGKLEKDVALNIANSLLTGQYDMPRNEVTAVLRKAFSLDLSEFIEGLILMGDKIAPVKDLLELCGMLQGDLDQNYINAFAKLSQAPKTIEIFNKTVAEIMGSFIPDTDLNVCYQEFVNNPPNAFSDQIIMGKVNHLFSVLMNCDNEEKKNVARWALTYLFDEEDVIHDDIMGLGYVDDMLVIDSALKIINN